MKKLILALTLVAGPLASAMPNSLDMTCAQAKAFVQKNQPATLATGEEWGNFSFNWADCGGNPPAYVCTKDVHYCFIGFSCQSVPTPTNPAGYYQGTNFCNAPIYTE